MNRQLNLFGSERITFDECVDLTIQSMNQYATGYDHWVFAWSGGKDSTTLVTLIISLIESGQIQRPKKITVLYADTRMELTPLEISAFKIMDQLKERNIIVKQVLAPLDKRFMVYMLGRGVPPPNNNTFRWCTRQIKLDPMQEEVNRLYEQDGNKMLLLTGVRQGESAIRDQRIKMSCTRDGAECGQGWFQQNINEKVADKLAPLLHWRVCAVWDWLKLFAPMKRYGTWQTEILADAYGGEEAEEINARTGCIGCPLAHKDTALEGILKYFPERWGYLEPLLGLRPIYRWLREPQNRLRKHGNQINADGKKAKNQYRLGPLTLEARGRALMKILDIEASINKAAKDQDKPMIDIINEEERKRICELIDQNTWPQGWNGDEPTGDQSFLQVMDDGSYQKSIFN